MVPVDPFAGKAELAALEPALHIRMSIAPGSASDMRFRHLAARYR